jgi:hypothetical protein
MQAMSPNTTMPTPAPTVEDLKFQQHVFRKAFPENPQDLTDERFGPLCHWAVSSPQYNLVDLFVELVIRSKHTPSALKLADKIPNFRQHFVQGRYIDAFGVDNEEQFKSLMSKLHLIPEEECNRVPGLYVAALKNGKAHIMVWLKYPRSSSVSSTLPLPEPASAAPSSEQGALQVFRQMIDQGFVQPAGALVVAALNGDMPKVELLCSNYEIPKSVVFDVSGQDKMTASLLRKLLAVTPANNDIICKLFDHFKPEADDMRSPSWNYMDAALQFNNIQIFDVIVTYMGFNEANVYDYTGLVKKCVVNNNITMFDLVLRRADDGAFGSTSRPENFTLGNIGLFLAAEQGHVYMVKHVLSKPQMPLKETLCLFESCIKGGSVDLVNFYLDNYPLWETNEWLSSLKELLSDPEKTHRASYIFHVLKHRITEADVSQLVSSFVRGNHLDLLKSVSTFDPNVLDDSVLSDYLNVAVKNHNLEIVKFLSLDKWKSLILDRRHCILSRTITADAVEIFNFLMTKLVLTA